MGSVGSEVRLHVVVQQRVKGREGLRNQDYLDNIKSIYFIQQQFKVFYGDKETKTQKAA